MTVLEVVIHPPKAVNVSGRYFPTTGYYGLTPVIVAGTIETRIPLQATSPLQVKRVVTRITCYETRSSTFGSDTENVLYENEAEVWRPEGEYGILGDWKGEFSMSVSPEVASFAPSSQWMREWKVVWKFEALIEHRPIPYVGSALSKVYEIRLYNHRMPSLPPPSPPCAMTLGSDSFSTQLSITPPHGAFGPGDTFTVGFHARPEEGLSIKKATMVLERCVEYLDESPKSVQRDISPDPSPGRFSLFRRSISPRPRLERIISDSVSPAESPTGRTLREKLAETSCDAMQGDGAMYFCSLPVEMAKRGGKWDAGEVFRSKLVNVTFELKLKVSIKSPRRVKEYTSGAIPIHLTATSMSERSNALAKMAPPDVKPATKRRHRSSRRGLYMQEGTIEISEPVAGGRRRKASSPVLPVSGIATDVKPILLPPSHPGQHRSISFVAPNPRPNLPPIQNIFNAIDTPIYSISAPSPLIAQHPNPSSSASSSRLLSPPDEFEAYHVQSARSAGRRISNTASEEEELQPCRHRQRRTSEIGDGFAFAVKALPSLDALGLGLPHVEESERPMSRPRTAPLHSTFAWSNAGQIAGEGNGRPVTSMGRMSGDERLKGGNDGRFAFTIPEEGEK